MRFLCVGASVFQVEDIDDAIDLVDSGVEVARIMLLDQDAECETIACSYADADGILNLSDADAEGYQIINNENQEENDND